MARDRLTAAHESVDEHHSLAPRQNSVGVEPVVSGSHGNAGPIEGFDIGCIGVGWLHIVKSGILLEHRIFVFRQTVKVGLSFVADI